MLVTLLQPDIFPTELSSRWAIELQILFFFALAFFTCPIMTINRRSNWAVKRKGPRYRGTAREEDNSKECTRLNHERLINGDIAIVKASTHEPEGNIGVQRL